MIQIRLFLLLLSINVVSGILSSISAQPFKMQMSQPLDIGITVDDGWAKVLQLRNGNTVLFTRVKDNGIEVLIFDNARNLIAKNALNGSLCPSDKVDGMSIRGLYEIAGKPVVFLSKFEHGRVSLYRLILNATTGAVVDEVKLVEASKNYYSMVGLKVEFVDRGDVAVEKDPETDNYCVVVLDAPKASTKEKMRVMHFDSSHKMISDAKIGSPSESYKFYHIISAIVDNDKRIFLAVYGAENGAGKNGHVHICRLNRGETAFQSSQIDIADDFKNAIGTMQYNNRTNTIQLLANTLTSIKPGFNGPIKLRYSSSMIYIDAETMKVKNTGQLTGEKIDNYLSNSLKMGKNFSGLPVKMVLEPDNTTTVINEEISQVIGQGSSTMFDDLGITQLSANGTEEAGYVIRKYQYTLGNVRSFYPSEKERGSWISRYDMPITWDYISSSSGKYILMNDTRENYEKEFTQKRKGVSGGTSDLNSVIYSVKDGSISKSFLFSHPSEYAESKKCLITTSHYDRMSQTYAVLLHEGEKQNTKTRLLWVRFGN